MARDNNSKMKRIVKEYCIMKESPPQYVSAAPVDELDMHRWQAIIFGPPQSAYAGGVFRLSILFPLDYPFKPPIIEFLTKIYHCNIINKHLCIDILKTQWSPALTIDKVLLSILSLLCDPNPNDPLNREAAEKFRNNKEEYNRTAQEWTKRYATDYSFREDDVF